jgi:hypothetical protein
VRVVLDTDDRKPHPFLILDFRLSKKDCKENAFIGSFSWLSIQNLKSKIQNVT